MEFNAEAQRTQRVVGIISAASTDRGCVQRKRDQPQRIVWVERGGIFQGRRCSERAAASPADIAAVRIFAEIIPLKEFFRRPFGTWDFLRLTQR